MRFYFVGQLVQLGGIKTGTKAEFSGLGAITPGLWRLRPGLDTGTQQLIEGPFECESFPTLQIFNLCD